MSILRAKVIVNPAAGANTTRRKWPHINQLLKNSGLSFDFAYTEGIGHAIELARDAASDGYSCLVSVGGDGTTNEVANGILNTGSSGEIALGVISTGTGSDFARSSGIPRRYSDACSCLIGSRRMLIDIGVVEYYKNGEKEKRFFINYAGIGFDAAVVEATECFPKYFGGTIPYVAGLLRTLIGYRNKLVVLSVGDNVESARVLSVVIANGNYIGGGMRVAPDASLNDNMLDIVVIGDVTKFDLLKSLPMVYKGTHGKHPKVSMNKAERVTVESPEALLVNADGELLGEGPATFSIIPAALNILV
jgi:diacylglycerol kinase (ATP)